MRRCVFIVLDGVGVGALPDAGEYGDSGSDTLGNLSRFVPLRLPNLGRLGLGNIVPLRGVPPVPEPLALCGRLAPLSAGKDTTVGHWEHMGLITVRPFPTYPQGFPDEIIRPFIERIGRGVLGNRPASGTEIIAELGEEHIRTGKPIVYTSADSVFQIAAHVGVVALEQLDTWCRVARDLLTGRHAVARVIARPFDGEVGSFARTKDRRDFSLAPPGPMYLDALAQAGVPVVALGKISEIFAGRGVSTQLKVGSNVDNLCLVQDLVRGRAPGIRFNQGLLMTNLVEFDMIWGHRNDVEGFATALETADAALADIVDALRPNDRLILTADHGVDPTTPSTDHSREYVPLLMLPRPAQTPHAVYEGHFSDTGATVAEFLTGEDPVLPGDVITLLRPGRGWRRYTPVLAPAGGATGRAPRADPLPCRVGKEEAKIAARWLEAALGTAPDVAVVLGSGLAPHIPGERIASMPYGKVPHWLQGRVEGHPCELSIASWVGHPTAILKGRVHEYEGYDLSEVQLHVRTLAAWGVKKVVLTSAAGAVDVRLAAGDVLMATEVLDFHDCGEGRPPARLQAGNAVLAEVVELPRSLHASVPGPQYETPAELAVLNTLGTATVSMSPAAELGAACDEGLAVAVLVVVVNVGDTSHEEVLSGAARARTGLNSALESVLRAWQTSTSLY
ncbi:MAG: phosphopentomutase [Actinobacteria bacterium]|jgi:phosphopentomutase|nr:phosphopentomutase [Actinomycetota bacterium]